MEREIVPHEQSFATLSLKPNGQIKNTGAHDRIPSNSATSRHEAPNKGRRRSLPEHDTPPRSMVMNYWQIFIRRKLEP
jgi:hypothetical protein